MKASILTGEGNLAAKEELDLRSGWKYISQKVEEFFDDSFESDWEEKTGLPWQEWAKYPYLE